MKKKILLFTLVAGLGALTISSYSGGAGNSGYDCSGADVNSGSGNPTGCSTGGGCHASAATAGITFVIELDSAGVTTSSTALGTGHYIPGFTYTVKITGTNTTSSTLPKWGFQVAATKGATAATAPVNAGTFQSTGLPTGIHYLAAPGTTATFFANVVEHTQRLTPTSGTGSTGTVYGTSFTWTAPAAGTGVVSLFGALNAVNSSPSGADGGDLWNTAHLVLNEATNTTAVNNIVPDFKINAFPNPVTNTLQLEINGAEAGTYNLQIVSVSGSVMSAAALQFNGTNDQKAINTSDWAAGVYYVTLSKDENTKTVTVVKK